MNELASEIRDNLDTLAARYDQRLRDLPGYDTMPADERLEVAQNVLQRVAMGLETGDQALFTESVQTIATERVAQGFDVESVLQATQVLVEIIEPLLTTVETANFLWRMLVQANATFTEVGTERVRIAEERFRRLAETTQDGVTIIEGDQVVYVNDRLSEILGYSTDELAEMSSLDFAAPEEKERLQAIIAELRQTGQGLEDLEFWAIRKDGSRRYLRNRYSISRVGDEITGRFVFTSDITERKESEAALQASEERFRQLVEESSDVFFTTNAEGFCTYVNPRGPFMTGYDLDEIIGMHFTDFVPDEWKKRVAVSYLKQARSRTGETVLEFPFETKDGERRWVEQIAQLLTDGDQITGFRCSVRDISERKELEQSIQESLTRRTQEVQTSTEIAQEVAAAPALDELYQRVVTLVKERFGYYHAQIFRHDPKADAMVVVEGYGEAGTKMKAAGHSLPYGAGVVGTAAATGEPVLASDVTEDPNWVPRPELPKTKGELAVPIKLRDEVLGVLDVQSDVVAALTEEDQVALLGLAGQIASAVESTQALEQADIFRQFAEASGQGMGMAALDGSIVYANSVLAHMLGAETPAAVRGQNIASFYPTDVVQQLQEEALPTVMTVGEWSGELPLISPEGELTPAIQSIFLIRDNKGEPLYLANVITDITERKQVEVEIEAQVQERTEELHKLASIVRYSSDLVNLATFDGKMVFLNEAGSKMLGIDPEEVEQVNIMQVIPDHLLDLVQTELLPTVMEKGAWEGDLQYRNLTTDELTDVHAMTFTILDPSTGAPLYLANISRDITERKQAEDALLRLERAVEQSIDGIAIPDLDGNIQFVNSAWAQMHGYGVEELQGQNLGIFHTEEQLQEDVIPFNERVMEVGANQGEVGHVRKDGTTFPTWMTTAVLKDEEGNPVGLVGTARDITARKRLEQAVQESLERRTEEVQISTEVAQEIAAAPVLDELYQRVVTLVKERFGYYHTQIFRHDPDANAMVVVEGYGEAGARMKAAGHSLPYGAGVVGMAASSGEPVLTTAVRQDPNWLPYPDLPATEGELAVPIKLGDEVLGVLDVQSDAASVLTQEDQVLLLGLAGQIATAIQNTRLFEQTQAALRDMEAAQRRYLRQAWSEYEAEEAIQGYFRSSEQQAPSAETWLPTVSAALQQADTVIEDDGADDSKLVIPISLYGEVIGTVGFRREDAETWRESDVAAAEAIVEQMALALDSQRLFDEAQQASFQMSQRVKELDSLNDIGRKMEETPPVPEFLQWVAESIPPAMQQPELCVAAIEQEGKVFGSAEAFDLPNQIVQSLVVGRRRVGRVCIAYTEDLDFADEESALLGDIARRVAGYIQSQRLLEETRVRAERLAVINRIAGTVGATFDLDELMESVYNEMIGSFMADAIFIALYHEASNEIEFAFAVEDGVRATPARYPLRGFSSIVIGEKRLLNIRNYEEERDQLPVPVMVGTPKIHASWLGAPMMIGDRVIGTICVMVDVPNAYSEEEELLLTTIADQVAGAIERARLFDEARIRAEEQAILNELSQALSARLDVDQILAEAHRGASRLLDTSRFSVGLYDEVQDTLSIALHVEDENVQWHSFTKKGDLGISGYIIRNREPVLIRENVLEWQQERGIDVSWVGEAVIPLCWLGVPLLMGERVLGVIFVQSPVSPQLYDEKDLDLLTAVANTTVIALESARLFDEARIRAEELATLNEMSRDMTAMLDVQAIVQNLHSYSSRLMDLTSFFVALYNEQEDEISFPLFIEHEEPVELPPRRGGKGLTEYVIRNGQPLLIEENVGDRLEELGIDSIGQEALSWLGVPMTVSGQILGVIAVQSYVTPRLYDEHHRDLLVSIASQAAIALENARLFEETQAALAEVEETHRSYLRAQWQDHLRQREALDRSGFLYDRLQADQQEELTATPDIWRPEMEQVISEGSPTTILDSSEESERAGLAIPITVRGQLIGVLGVESPAADRQWSENDMALIEAVGEQLGQTLESARLFADTQRRAERERLIGEITAKIRATTDVRDILETAATELGQALGVSRSTVRLGVEELDERTTGEQVGADGE